LDKWKCVVATGADITRHREIPRYAEGLYELGRGLYAWMVPNGSWGESNCGLIVGDGEALLVDTQWDLPCTQAVLGAAAQVLGSARITHVVNTHSDGDHCWGNQLLPSAQTISSQATFDEMLELHPRSMIELGLAARTLGRVPAFKADRVGQWFRGMLASYRFGGVTRTRARYRFEGQMNLTVGGRQIELIELGPAHTSGDLIVHVPDARAVFTGDLLFIDCTPVMWAGPLENWLAALDRILEMDQDVIVPGHGPIADRAAIRRLKGYFEFVDREARQRYDAGVPADKAAREIVLSKDFAESQYAAWDSPERLLVNVHTLYRQYAGRKGHRGKLAILNMMRKQALLAQMLPDATPAFMRRR